MGDIVTQGSIFAVLLAFLVVGFFYKKKPKSLGEYALGSKRFTTPTLIATMVATSIGGGSIIGFSSKLYQEGVWLFWALCAMPIGYCLMALFIVPKLSKYYGRYSVAEVIGCMYGAWTRKLVGIVAFVFCVGVLAGQIKALHWVMEHVFSQNTVIITLVALSIVVLYSSLGGVSSVIKTDVVQFIVFMVIVPALAYYMIVTSGGISQIIQSLPEDKGTFLSRDGTNVWGVISLGLFYLIPGFDAPVFHRFLIGRDCKKNQTSSYVFALVKILNLIFVACVAFIAISKFPNINPKETVFTVMQGVFSSRWVTVLFAIALIAMIASTADSVINTASIVLINDVMPSNITEKQKLILLQSVTIFSGIAATAITFLFSGVLDIVWFFSEYYSVIVSPPFIVGLFLKELRKETFWASASIGVIVFSLLHLVYHDLGHEIFLISFSSSLLAYFFTFFVVKKQKLSKYEFSLHKTSDGIVTKLPVKETSLGWIVLTFYLCSFIFNSYMGRVTIVNSEIITALLGGVLLFSEAIKNKFKSIIILGILWFCFLFAPMYSFLTQETVVYFMVWLAGSILLLSYLLDWVVFVPFLLSGGVVTIVVFCALSKNFEISTLAPVMNLGLLLACVALVTYIFGRKGMYSYRLQKTLEDLKKSSNADEKYKSILLKDNTTTEVYFEDLKKNIINYFHRLELERGSRLTMPDIRQGKINTKLPIGVFYNIVNSLIFNTLHCGEKEELLVKLYCNRCNEIKKIEMIHGDYKIQHRLECLQYSEIKFSKEILRWDVMKELFEKLNISIEEERGRLTICFPSSKNKIYNNIIYIKDLLPSNSSIPQSFLGK